MWPIFDYHFPIWFEIMDYLNVLVQQGAVISDQCILKVAIMPSDRVVSRCQVNGIEAGVSFVINITISTSQDLVSEVLYFIWGFPVVFLASSCRMFAAAAGVLLASRTEVNSTASSISLKV